MTTSVDLTEAKDNLATDLATTATERLGKLMVDLHELTGPFLSEADQRTLMQYAFDAFDGLTQQFREILDDREHADLFTASGPTVSPETMDEIFDTVDRRIGTFVQSMEEVLDGCSYDHEYTKRHTDTAATGLKIDVERLIHQKNVAEVSR